MTIEDKKKTPGTFYAEAMVGGMPLAAIVAELGRQVLIRLDETSASLDVLIEEVRETNRILPR